MIPFDTVHLESTILALICLVYSYSAPDTAAASYLYTNSYNPLNYQNSKLQINVPAYSLQVSEQ